MLNSLGLNKPNAQTKVCVAMSGGVDSSAAAIMLKQQGYEVFGLTMDLLQPPYAPEISSIQDAAKVAKILGIEHHFIDYKKEFADKVVHYFTSAYQEGLTPSPCILCNRHIKLGLLADKARELGADILVTGHYADIQLTTNGVELHKGADLKKDQSYFLFDVAKHNLEMLRCPLAVYTKEETRALVQSAGLEIYKKSDSQDICFVSNGKYADLIKALNPDFQNTEGDIVLTDGKIIGRHKGLINYTVGQRRGLGIGGDIGILYVLKLDVKNNRLIVGHEDELKQKKVLIKDVNWLAEGAPLDGEYMVKLRSRQKEVPARIHFLANGMAEVNLLNDFYGVAPGQGCCIYNKTRVMGGGFICKQDDI